MNKYLVIAVLVLAGCATIVKDEKAKVNFIGPNGVPLTLNTPDGKFEVVGETPLMVTRSGDDIPIVVTCEGKSNNGTLPTSFDVGWGGFGNLIFGGIPGWIIDGVGNKAYDPPESFDLAPLCEGHKPALAAAGAPAASNVDMSKLSKEDQEFEALGGVDKCTTEYSGSLKEGMCRKYYYRRNHQK